ncbi:MULTISPECIES: glycosyltransferase family 2 protein [unclassified Variovorax]|uniref:glycosyltransferase family 2 protein n=1 Tax=unclassified Variovorax TaxID=663243 RepID=UPI003F44DCCB
MKLSIVATLYQSAAYIDEFCRRAGAAATQLAGDDYEIVLVNDGSPDNSLNVAVQLTQRDSHVVVVDLSRNFGHHKAMMTGLSAARGERVFLIDSDLEEEPEWLTSFADQMEADASDVVYGVQAERRGGFVEQMTGTLFYKLFRTLTGIVQPSNIVTARLMTRRYVDGLLMHEERELNIGGLWVITGFRQSQQVVRKHATSPTTYSLSRKFSHLVNAITSFSSLPLVFTFYSGLLISASALLFIVYLLLRFVFGAAPPSGYTSIVASIWLFSGLIVFFLGVQGIYIAKIFSEVKRRPYTIVRQVFAHPDRAGKQI